ncbi:MAG: hypothetical protein ABI583_06530 [Betaproteobacteria bacterium]
MLKPKKHLACLAILICMTPGQSWAASSAASSASDSIGTSVGSASGSLQTSSGSSSKGLNVADGDYRVVAVDTAQDRPGLVRMKLMALAGNSEASELLLYVPQAAFDKGRLTQGGTVAARKRSYGAEFANAETREVFFLVLHDDWYRELRANAVAL